MKEKWELYEKSLEEIITVGKREFLLIAAVCVLGGMVLGLIFSPRKWIMIGSNNGNNNGNDSGNNSANKSGNNNGSVDEQNRERGIDA